MIHQAKQKGRIMKRRMIAVLLSGILLCSAAGCGKEAVTDKSSIVVSGSDRNSGGRRKPGGLIVQRRFYSRVSQCIHIF